MREQINKVKNWKEFLNENTKNIITLFHGSETPQDFSFKKERNFLPDRIIFLSTSKFFSTGYGKYLYEVAIQPKKIFDSTSNYDMEKLIDEMLLDEYYEPYEDKYYTDFEDYIENNQYKYSDTWEGIEYIIKKYGINIFSEEGYDCLLITEGGETNYIIFNNEIILNHKQIDKIKN